LTIDVFFRASRARAKAVDGTAAAAAETIPLEGIMRARGLRTIVLVGFAVAFGPAVALAETVITPLQGQTAEQIQRDQADCRSIAASSATTPPAEPASGRRGGGRARGAARGAAAGAVAAEVRGQQYDRYDNLSDDAKREYRQNNAGSAAAAGAMVGASRQRQQRRQDAAQQQQAQANAAAANEQAYRSCLMGRGYSVQ
jgi:hypothetical protein